MTIIRVEHPQDGKGIWRSKIDNNEWRFDKINNNAKMSDRHSNFPSPNRDKKLKGIKPNEFCAFKSIYQLQKWITKSELIEFISLGFKIYALTISDCKVGTHQLLYKKENIVTTNDITMLFN